jgi:tetratricopeptide (TPR) repeat protein
MRYFNIALDINSENIIALACKADSLLAIGKFSESLECLNKIFSIRDDIIMTKITKCYVLSYLDKFDESLDGFKEIDKLDFDDYGLKRSYYSYYAKSLVNMKRLEDALKVYDEFLDNYSFNEEIKKDRDELFDKINK